MQGIDSGACRTSSGMAQSGALGGPSGFHGSPQDRADALVRATVLSDLGQGSGHGRHSHGIPGVANAVRSALAGQDVTGTDAADDVLKKIETSLHKAAQKLADRGVDAQTIDATIDRFRSQLANALEGMGGASSGGGTSSASETTGGAGSVSSAGSSGSADDSSPAQTPSAPAPTGTTRTTSVSKFVAREVRKERGTIDLVTAEGDHVSIRFRSKEVTAGSVTQSTAADGSSTTASQASLFSRGGVKIDVDGNLNDNELKAIGDLLGKVDDIATKFFSGDVQAAFSAASSIGVDSDQIAAYRLNVTYSRKIAAYGAVAASLPASAQTSTQAPPSPTASTGNSAAATNPADSTNSTESTDASGPTPDSTSASPAASSAASPSTGGASAAAIGDATTGADASSSTATPGTPDATPPPTPASAQKTLIAFINDALSKLGSVTGSGRVSFSMHWKVNALVTALQSVQPTQPTTPSDHAAATNTQLLSDSLQKITAA
jgi:hypothetical protein